MLCGSLDVFECWQEHVGFTATDLSVAGLLALLWSLYGLLYPISPVLA